MIRKKYEEGSRLKAITGPTRIFDITTAIPTSRSDIYKRTLKAVVTDSRTCIPTCPTPAFRRQGGISASLGTEQRWDVRAEIS
jgi:hypothetical protein